MTLNVVFVFTNTAIWVYIEKEVVFADISNHNTSTYKIIWQAYTTH